MYTILHFKLTSPTHTPQIAHVHSPWLRFYILNYHPLKHLELHTSMHHVNDSTLEKTITPLPPHTHTLNYTRSFPIFTILHLELSPPQTP